MSRDPSADPPTAQEPSDRPGADPHGAPGVQPVEPGPWRWARSASAVVVAALTVAALAVLVPASCGPRTSDLTFVDDYASAYCDKASICMWPELSDDFDACVDSVGGAMDDFRTECGNFDNNLASECLREIRNMSCDDGLDYVDPELHPGSCRSVFNCYGTL